MSPLEALAVDLSRAEARRVVPFHLILVEPTREALLAYAVRDLDAAIPALVLAANEATSRAELMEQRDVLREHVRQTLSVVEMITDLAAAKFPRFSEQE